MIVSQIRRAAKLKNLAINICERKFGVGADGLLILERSKAADVRMRVFNADGSEAEMCGNGARCVALYVRDKISKSKSRILIATKAGIIASEVYGDNVKIKLTDPEGLKLDIPIRIGSRTLRVNFINTGVPHAVIFTEGLDKIDTVNLGRYVRYHKAFAPRGANVNFAEVLNNRSISLRTYERGVEDETLACGTGAVASAVIFSLKSHNFGDGRYVVNVKTKGSEMLKVYFDKTQNRFANTWLEGRARIVAEGVYYV